MRVAGASHFALCVCRVRWLCRVGLAVAVFVVRAVPVSAQGEIRFFLFFSFLVGAGAVCIVGIVVVGLIWGVLVGLVGAWGGVGGICGSCWFFPTTCDTMRYFDMLFNFMYEMQKCPFIRLFKFIQTHSITF